MGMGGVPVIMGSADKVLMFSILRSSFVSDSRQDVHAGKANHTLS
jgi:hypothetical protein